MKVTRERIDVSLLRIDPRYQRKLCKAWVRRIADHFDQTVFGIVHASLRANGSYWVMDGQHRLAALALLEPGKCPARIDCLVYHDLTPKDEARIFAELNTSRSVRAFDKFRARMQAGEVAACEIGRAIKAAGFSISDKGTLPGQMKSVQACETVYLMGGNGLLQRTLELLRLAWPEDGTASHGSIVHGLGHLLHVAGDKIDDNRMLGKMQRLAGGANGLIGDSRGRRAVEGGAMYMCVSDALRSIYNRGLRSAQIPALR